MENYRHSDHSQAPGLVRDLFSVLDFVVDAFTEFIPNLYSSYSELATLRDAHEQFLLIANKAKVRLASSNSQDLKAQVIVIRQAMQSVQVASQHLGIDPKEVAAGKNLSLLLSAAFRLLDVVDGADVFGISTVAVAGIKMAAGAIPVLSRKAGVIPSSKELEEGLTNLSGLIKSRRGSLAGGSELSDPYNRQVVEDRLRKEVKILDDLSARVNLMGKKVRVVKTIEGKAYPSPGTFRRALREAASPLGDDLRRAYAQFAQRPDFANVRIVGSPSGRGPQFTGTVPGAQSEQLLGQREPLSDAAERIRKMKEYAAREIAQKEAIANSIAGENQTVRRELRESLGLNESKIEYFDHEKVVDTDLRMELMGELNFPGSPRASVSGYEFDEVTDEIFDQYLEINNAFSDEQRDILKRIYSSQSPAGREFLAGQYKELASQNALISARYWGRIEETTKKLVGDEGGVSSHLIREEVSKEVGSARDEAEQLFAAMAAERSNRVFLPKGMEPGSVESRSYFLDKSLSDFPSRSLFQQQGQIQSALGSGLQPPSKMTSAQRLLSFNRATLGTSAPLEGSNLLLFNRPLEDVIGGVGGGSSVDASRIQSTVKDYIQDTIGGGYRVGRPKNMADPEAVSAWRRRSTGEIFGTPDVRSTGELPSLLSSGSLDPSQARGRSLVGLHSGLVDPFGRQLVPGAASLQGLDIPKGADPRRALQAYEVYARILYKEQFDMADKLAKLRRLGERRGELEKGIRSAEWDAGGSQMSMLDEGGGSAEALDALQAVEKMKQEIANLDRQALETRREYAAVMHRLVHKPLGGGTVAHRERQAYEAMNEFWRTERVKGGPREAEGFLWIGGDKIKGDMARIENISELYPFGEAGKFRGLDPEAVARSGERGAYSDYLSRMMGTGQLKLSEIREGSSALLRPEGFSSGMQQTLGEWQAWEKGLGGGKFYESFSRSSTGGGSGKRFGSSEWKHYLSSLEGGGPLFSGGWRPPDPKASGLFGQPIAGRVSVPSMAAPAVNRAPVSSVPDRSVILPRETAAREAPAVQPAAPEGLDLAGRNYERTETAWKAHSSELLDMWDHLNSLDPKLHPGKEALVQEFRQGALGRLLERALGDRQYFSKIRVRDLAREHGLVGTEAVGPRALGTLHGQGLIDDTYAGRDTLFTSQEADRLSAYGRGEKDILPKIEELDQAALQLENVQKLWQRHLGGTSRVGAYGRAVSHGLGETLSLGRSDVGHYAWDPKKWRFGYKSPQGGIPDKWYQDSLNRVGAGIHALGSVAAKVDKAGWMSAAGVGAGYGVAKAYVGDTPGMEPTFERQSTFAEKPWWKKEGQWLMPQIAKDRAYWTSGIEDLAGGGTLSQVAGGWTDWMSTLSAGVGFAIPSVLGIPATAGRPEGELPEGLSEALRLAKVSSPGEMQPKGMLDLYGGFMQGGGGLELFQQALRRTGDKDIGRSASLIASRIAKRVGSQSGLALNLSSGNAKRLSSLPSEILRPEVKHQEDMAKVYAWLQSPFDENDFSEGSDLFKGVPGRAFPGDDLKWWQSGSRVPSSGDKMFGGLDIDVFSLGVPGGVEMPWLFEKAHGSNVRFSDFLANRKELMNLARQLNEPQGGTDLLNLRGEYASLLNKDSEMQSLFSDMLSVLQKRSAGQSGVLEQAHGMRMATPSGTGAGDAGQVRDDEENALGLAALAHEKMVKQLAGLIYHVENRPGESTDSRRQRLAYLKEKYRELEIVFQQVYEELSPGYQAHSEYIGKSEMMGAQPWQSVQLTQSPGGMSTWGSKIGGQAPTLDLPSSVIEKDEWQKDYDRKFYSKGVNWGKVRNTVLDKWSRPDGQVLDVYSGQPIAREDAQVEHMIPMSLIDRWMRKHRPEALTQEYANELYSDPRNLIPVSGQANQERGSLWYGSGMWQRFKPEDSKRLGAIRSRVTDFASEILPGFQLPGMPGMQGGTAGLDPAGALVPPSRLVPQPEGRRNMTDVFRVLQAMLLELQKTRGGVRGGLGHVGPRLEARDRAIVDVQGRPDYQAFAAMRGTQDPFFDTDEPLTRAKAYLRWVRVEGNKVVKAQEALQRYRFSQMPLGEQVETYEGMDSMGDLDQLQLEKLYSKQRGIIDKAVTGGRKSLLSVAGRMDGDGVSVQDADLAELLSGWKEGIERSAEVQQQWLEAMGELNRGDQERLGKWEGEWGASGGMAHPGLDASVEEMATYKEAQEGFVGVMEAWDSARGREARLLAEGEKSSKIIVAALREGLVYSRSIEAVWSNIFLRLFEEYGRSWLLKFAEMGAKFLVGSILGGAASGSFIDTSAPATGGTPGGWFNASGGSGIDLNFSGRMSGGPVQKGRPVLVGEVGPELVVPQASGYVIPAETTKRMMGSRAGSLVVNITFNIESVDGPGVQAALAAAEPRLTLMATEAAYGAVARDLRRPSRLNS